MEIKKDILQTVFNEDTIEDMIEDCEIENVEEVDASGDEN